MDAPVSALAPLDETEVDSAGVDGAAGGGGGSMTEEAGDCFERGSGRDGMGSSAEDVSMVIFRVAGGD